MGHGTHETMVGWHVQNKLGGALGSVLLLHGPLPGQYRLLGVHEGPLSNENECQQGVPREHDPSHSALADRRDGYLSTRAL